MGIKSRGNWPVKVGFCKECRKAKDFCTCRKERGNEFTRTSTATQKAAG